MASTSVIMAAGLADGVCSFILVYLAWLGDAIFMPLLKWYYGFFYSSTPVIDPGLITVVPGIFYGLLFACFCALQVGLYLTIASKSVYGYDQP